MISKKIFTYIHIFIPVLMTLFFTSFVLAKEKNKWEKCMFPEFENFFHISSDAQNNEHLCSHTPDGQIFYSINGHKIWWNKNVNSEKNEPSALISFSAGAVQKFDISYTALSILPKVTIEGTVWGILAPDPAKKPKEKYLYRFISGNFGYYWEKDETMPYTTEYVSAAHDGTVLVLTNDGPYLKIDNEPWRKLECSTKLTFVAAGNKEALYALTDKHIVLVWKNNRWEILENNNQKDDIKHIAAKNDGTLYCVDDHGKIFSYREKNGWESLPDIKNAERITVSPKKIFCWTSQAYGNATLKNQINFLGKAATLISGGGMAILGAGTTLMATAGIGSVVTGASIAAPLTLTPSFAEKTKKTAKTVSTIANNMEDIIDDMDMPRFSDIDLLMASYEKESKAKSIASFAKTVYKSSPQGLIPALALTALGVTTIQAIPVFILGTTAVSLLLGGSSIIALVIFSRPHKNEIYELSQTY